MPYIKPEDRKRYDEKIKELVHEVKKYTWSDDVDDLISPAGQLNYIITTLLLGVYDEVLPNYEDINEIIGIFECAKLEFYRRTAAPYEDKKIIENGDVAISFTRK
jgi:hypothetical protein